MQVGHRRPRDTENRNEVPSVDFPTLKVAVDSLNLYGVGAGGVIINVTAGYTEPHTATLSLTATGTAANPIVIQKFGAGDNPSIIAPTGGPAIFTTTTTLDGIFRFVGSDWVTLDGFNLNENPSNTGTALMEYGLAFYKVSGTNGCNRNTIQNCVITLNRNNTLLGTILPEIEAGSCAIFADQCYFFCTVCSPYSNKTAVNLVFVGAPASGDLAWHLCHDVLVDAGASLALVEHHIDSDSHRHLDNTTTTVRVAEGAQLTHVRIQRRQAGATSFLHTDGPLRTDARYTRIDVELGGVLVRHELGVHLAGDRAQLVANGVLLASGRAHVETRLGIRHDARDSNCGLMWRGIGDARGRVVFHGGITIEAGADGTDARLSNKNLLLSSMAEIDTQPVLVIHADEVQAAHGATVGQLDANAMFYLRSRGLPCKDFLKFFLSNILQLIIFSNHNRLIHDQCLLDYKEDLFVILDMRCIHLFQIFTYS